MSYLQRGSSFLTINFDGSIEDLEYEIGKVESLFSKYSIYKPALDKIKGEIIPNYNRYKDYSIIYFGTMSIKNNSVRSFNPYFIYESSSQTYDQPLYKWEYTKILLYFLVIFIVIIFIITIYCYIYDIDIYGHIYKLF